MKQPTQLRALDAAEIDQVTGGTDLPVATGIWEWLPGIHWPWWDPSDNPIPGEVPQP